MADTSILITAKDNYSDALKKMQATTKTFGKDVDSMQKKLDALTATKYKLKADFSDAKKEFKDLQKQMDSNKEVTQELSEKYQRAQETVDTLSSHLKVLSKEAEKTKKSMDQLSGAASGKESFFNKANNFMKDSGGWNQLLSAGQNYASSIITSYAGNEIGGYISDAISATISGAVTGASIGGVPGAIAGGVVSLGSSVINSMAQANAKKDELFSDYISDQYNTWLETRTASLSEGTTIAAGRETDRISFNTLLGSEQNAAALLSDLEDYAARTPFAYDDLTAASRTLLSYGVGQGDILSYLGAIGDAGAAVGLSGSDVATLATYLGRIKSNGTVTQEYLNPMQERGIDVYGMLAEDIGVSIAELKEAISDGAVDGAAAVNTLIARMQEEFGGSMEEMSSTYSGLTSTLEDTQAQLAAAEGAAYNQERKSGKGGLSDQIAWYEENMKDLRAGYSAMGEYQASLENTRDQAFLDAMDAALDSEQYKNAKAANDGAEMGKILAEAQAKAQNDYLTSDAYLEYQQTQIDIVNKMQAQGAVSEAYLEFGYELGKELTKGVRYGMDIAGVIETPVVNSDGGYGDGSATWEKLKADLIASGKYDDYIATYGDPGSHASGLYRVPYDGYPAILHEGERVLTANTVRQLDSGFGGVSVVIQNCTVRQDSDIEAIAESLYEHLAAAQRGMR